MGGSSKKQTVGYKYYLGMHQVLCHGPIDYISEIRVDDRVAWTGFAQDNEITIAKPNLFGGEKREGGVEGDIDIMLGGPTQTKNPYLQARLGTDIPSFRGVVSAVLKHCYVGMNPYLKRWSFKAQRVNVRQDGIAQWYIAKAPIGYVANRALYIAMDISNSMAAVTSNGQTRLVNLKAALEIALSPLLGLPASSNVDIKVQAFAGSSVSITRTNATGSDVQDIIDWINARDYTDVSNGTTKFDVAINGATAFFAAAGNKTPVSIFLTDGEATGGTEVTAGAIFDGLEVLYPELKGYGINIDLSDTSDTAYLDNTPEDGIPVTDGGDPSSIVEAVTKGLSAHFDLNPAHIIRECLTDPDWGMGYAEADIDDTSFMAAADTMFDEGMGISLLWDRQTSIESFVNEIVKHIDAALYLDRTTGKFVLKLIRDDYDEGTLLVLDESNIEKLDNLSRPTFGELTNSVTVNFWDHTTTENASVTIQDTAMVQMMNATINTTIQYPGFTNQGLAARVLMRDLRTLSSPLWSATIFTGSVAKDLTIGGVFKLSWLEYGLDEVIMRITGIAYGDGKNNKIRIQATQDQFALQAGAAVSTPDPDDGWVPIDDTPAPCPVRLVTETPYYELVTQLGQTSIDASLADNKDLGYLLAAGSRPAAEAMTNATLLVDTGSGYAESAIMDFSPVAYLNGDVTEAQTVVPIQDGTDLDLAVVGTLAQINGEQVRVDAVSASSVTLGRGVHDTAPRAHSDGDAIIFWDDYPSSDETEYVATESLNVKMLPQSGSSALDEASTPADSVTFDSRAFRPYPPGNFKINTNLYPETISGSSELSLTWAHRDRTQQTSGNYYDHTQGDIGPEVGTTYTLRIYGEVDSLLRTETGLTGTSYTYAEADELADSLIPLSGGGTIQTEVFDTFTDTDGVQVTAHTPDASVNSWQNIALLTTPSANTDIQSNSARMTLDSAGVAIDSEVSNCTVSMDWTPGVAGNDRNALVFRYQDVDNMLIFNVRDPNGDWRLNKYIAGVENVIASGSFSWSGGTTYNIKIVLEDDNISCLIDNVEVANENDSFLQTETTHGFIRNAGSNDARINNFLITTVLPDYRFNGKLTVQLESVREGYQSWTAVEHQVFRAGYGFRYGEFYGGS